MVSLKSATGFIRVTAIVAASLAAASCGGEGVGNLAVGYTPHERYERSLRDMGLAQTALGSDWLAASSHALSQPVSVVTPYREVSYLDPADPGAVGYQITLRRGQRVTASIEVEADTGFRVFLDMFVVPNGSRTSPILLASADSSVRDLEYVARRDGDYVLRVQPELLRGGRYEVTILVGASLAFPVGGHDTTAIRSGWFAPRDGGRRRHEGVDIFAPRGTPVVAAAKGTVVRTGTNRLGGNVIWLRDEIGRSLYYAHLDRHLVERGTQVFPGDTLGLVGNTGNARTTPPHLHFGVYQRGFGPFDPYPALYQPPTATQMFSGDSAAVGAWVRVTRDRTRVRSMPRRRSSVVSELVTHTPLHVVAGVGNWYRVELPNGLSGFVQANFTELIDTPLRHEVVASGTLLRSRPELAAAALDSVVAGAEVPVLGEFEGFIYVEAPSGRAGWLRID